MKSISATTTKCEKWAHTYARHYIMFVPCTVAIYMATE